MCNAQILLFPKRIHFMPISRKYRVLPVFIFMPNNKKKNNRSTS